MVLGGDEDTRRGDEAQDLGLRLVLEEPDAEEVLLDVLYLHV